ncbi:unnamed protein product, partial [Discosporangium mesarthrocarpum]
MTVHLGAGLLVLLSAAVQAGKADASSLAFNLPVSAALSRTGRQRKSLTRARAEGTKGYSDLPADWRTPQTLDESETEEQEAGGAGEEGLSTEERERVIAEMKARVRTPA